MSIVVGGVSFDRVVYDDIADVLYLTVGQEPVRAADALATPEGHVVRYAETGEIVGITFVNAKWLSEKEGELALFRVPSDDLAMALS